MSLKTFLQEIKARFDLPIAPVAPVAAATPPPAAPAAPAPAAGKTYKLQDGTEISIAQAGDIPAVGDVVSILGAPAPEGVLTLEDTSTITVDATGTITQVSVAAPMTQDLSQAPPVPTLEQRIAAIEISIAALKPAPVATYSAEFEKLDADGKRIEKLEATIKDLFALVDKIIEIPTAEPQTLNGAKKEAFDRADKKEKAYARIAEAITQMKSKS